MISQAGQLKASLSRFCDSYLFPLRVRSRDAKSVGTWIDAKSVGTWIIVQFCPLEPLGQRLTLYAGRALDLSFLEADDPNGPFTPAN